MVENRIERLREVLKKANLDTLMVSVGENRRYLSGFTGEDTQFDETAGALFITEGKLLLATDSRYDLQAKQEAPLYEVLCYKKGLEEALPDIVGTLGTRRLGFESVRVTCLLRDKIEKRLKNGIELVPTEDTVEQLRIVKEEDEIRSMKKALSMAETAFENVKGSLSEGMSEKEAAWILEKALRDAGADSLSFPSIVATGPNSALPHAIPGDRMFASGEPVIFDWGTRLEGYCSDISRTVIIGKPDGLFEKVFQTVLDAQRMAIKAIKPGVSSKAVDRIARDHIESKGFKEKFGHGLGHGIGLAVHEAPRLSPIKDDTLKEGMVFTVEPGVYLPDWGGIRLENMVVVRKDGAEVLNATDPGEGYRL